MINSELIADVDVADALAIELELKNSWLAEIDVKLSNQASKN